MALRLRSKTLSFFFIYSLFINLSEVLSHVYNQGNCGMTSKNQSPVNINSEITKYYEEKYFRILLITTALSLSRQNGSDFPRIRL